RGVPHPRADDDERVRARRPDTREPDLREAGSAGPHARRHARRPASDGRRHGRRRLLPRGCHRSHRGAGRVGPPAPAGRAHPGDRATRGPHRGPAVTPATAAPVLAQAAQGPGTATASSGETVLFWLLAPVMVLAALGLLFSRRAVYAAMAVVLVMVCIAAMYIAQDATFLGVAQVVVYTGAIMMLFLFVLMLVGV